MLSFKKQYEAYLTVYLALIMSLLISLCLALIEGVRYNAVCLESECITDISLNSILAEYHRELLKQYNLFGIDSSYGTTLAGSNKIAAHMEHYMSRNLAVEDIILSDFLYRDFLGLTLESVNVKKASILTDGEGAVFRQRAMEAMEDEYGITGMEQLMEWLSVSESHGLFEKDIAKEKQMTDAQIEEYNGQEVQLSEGEWTTIEIDNPTSEIEVVRRTGILELVTEEAELSGKVLHSEDLVASRRDRGEISRGNANRQNLSDWEELAQSFLFQQYLMHYMGSYLHPKEEGALSYQIEYLLIGKDRDSENLKGVVNTLCAVREAANVCYLYSDASKCAEAEAVATALATTLGVPEISPLLKTSLLLGWAYAESLYDVRCLLEGGKIPLLKNSNSWHYSLQGALQMEEGEKTEQAGLSYEDYLRIMLMLEKKDILTDRAMNMVEADIRMTPGNRAFRLDACYDYVEIEVEIKSKYGYDAKLVRQKGY